MANSISTLGQMLDNNARLRDIRGQLNTLQIQLSSGKKAQVFSGLGDAGIQSQQLRVEINQISVFQTNIATGQTRLNESAKSLEEFMAQAKNMSDTMAGQLQEGTIDVDQIKKFAATTLGYMRELLNVKDDDRYLLSGADGFNSPIQDTGASATYMSDLVSKWRAGTIDTNTLISSYTATPETTMGYSSALSSDQVRGVYVRADVNTDVDYTLTADSPGFKDILNALTLMANMDVDKVTAADGDNPATLKLPPGTSVDEQKQNFYNVYEDMIKTVNSGIDKLRLEDQRLQRANLVLDTTAANHKTDLNTLQSALDGVENADPAEVAVKISSLQTQLSAAYQVTALLGSLSLSNYLS